MQPEEADGEESVATGVGSRPRPQLFGPPPVIQMAFRRAEPKALTEGLLAAVKALAEEGDVDRRLALRWL